MKSSFSCSCGRLIGSNVRFVIFNIIVFVGHDVEQVVQSIGTMLIVLDKSSYIILFRGCMLQKLCRNCAHMQLWMFMYNVMRMYICINVCMHVAMYMYVRIYDLYVPLCIDELGNTR
jgi:hypothetical protein